MTKANTYQEYLKWRSKLINDDNIMGGTTVFPGTRLPVIHIGELANKSLIEEIKEDYPYLSKKDIEFAQIFSYERIFKK